MNATLEPIESIEIMTVRGKVKAEIVSVNISFWNVLWLMMYVGIASVPAGLFLMFVYFIFFAAFMGGVAK